MADNSNILSDFGINLLEEDIDDVIFQTNEFLCDATFTGSQGPFWWILQMSMALAALFSIIVAAGMAYKMMVKHEQGRRITLWYQFGKERTVPSCSLSFCLHAALSFILFYPC